MNKKLAQQVNSRIYKLQHSDKIRSVDVKNVMCSLSLPVVSHQKMTGMYIKASTARGYLECDKFNMENRENLLKYLTFTDHNPLPHRRPEEYPPPLPPQIGTIDNDFFPLLNLIGGMAPFVFFALGHRRPYIENIWLSINDHLDKSNAVRVLKFYQHQVRNLSIRRHGINSSNTPFTRVNHSNAFWWLADSGIRFTNLETLNLERQGSLNGQPISWPQLSKLVYHRPGGPVFKSLGLEYLRTQPSSPNENAHQGLRMSQIATVGLSRATNLRVTGAGLRTPHWSQPETDASPWRPAITIFTSAV